MINAHALRQFRADPADRALVLPHVRGTSVRAAPRLFRVFTTAMRKLPKPSGTLKRLEFRIATSALSRTILTIGILPTRPEQ